MPPGWDPHTTPGRQTHAPFLGLHGHSLRRLPKEGRDCCSGLLPWRIRAAAGLGPGADLSEPTRFCKPGLQVIVKDGQTHYETDS